MDKELQEGSAKWEAEVARVTREELVRSSSDLEQGLRLNLEYQRSSKALEKELLALIRAGQKMSAGRILPSTSVPTDLERAGLRDSLAELGRSIEVEKHGVCRPYSAVEMRPRDPAAEARVAESAARARRLIMGPVVGGVEAAFFAASGGNQAIADQAASLALDVLVARGLGGPKLGADISVKPEGLEVGVTVYEGNTRSVFRKMSSAEAQKTFVTSRLQPPERGANSSKYLSESLDKVEAFQNKAVKQGTKQKILEFVVDRKGYEKLLSTQVDQFRSKGKDAVKVNLEGIKEDDPALRNIGVPKSKLDDFNKLVVKVWKVR